MKKSILILIFIILYIFKGDSQDVVSFKKEMFSIDSMVYHGQIKELREAKKKKLYNSLFILRASKSIDYIVIIIHDRELMEFFNLWISNDELISLRGLDDVGKFEIYYRKY